MFVYQCGNGIRVIFNIRPSFRTAGGCTVCYDQFDIAVKFRIFFSRIFKSFCKLFIMGMIFALPLFVPDPDIF